MSGGITGFLTILSFLGGAAFLGGIALVVISASQGRPIRGGVFLAILGLIVGLVFAIISQGILFVDVTQVAVITNVLTGQLEDPRDAGTSVIVPGVQRATLYPINQQEYTMTSNPDEGERAGDDSVQATTIDGQIVGLDITVFYSLDPVRINNIHQRWNGEYSPFIRSTARTVVRDVVAHYTAEQIYGEGRPQMQQDINDSMRAEFDSESFLLNRVDVRGLQFSDQFRQAIEDKIAQEQSVQQAEIVVTQRQQEAEQVRVQAQGRRDAAILEAQGDAQSTVLRAQADAEALRLVSEQIAANPLLIQYLYVQNLSDNVNIALVPANSPFLFDLSSFTPNDDFTAPAVPTSDIVVPEVTVTPAP
jgi:regulator of protease activity HflC (stomatin/prohibitin superfamily)